MSEFIEATGHAAPAVAAAGAGVALLQQLVGPTAKVFGTTVASFVEHRMRNWLGIAKAAEHALGDDPDPGQVHPRVVHRVLEEATYLDDQVMQQYAGGLLAASRSREGDDDRAAYYINLLGSLTANQIRLHHAIYSALADHSRPAVLLIGDMSQYEQLTVKASVKSAAAVLHVRPGENPEDVVTDTVHGLIREGLLYGRRYVVGGIEEFRRVGVVVWEPSLFVRPNAVGALLYLWGRGVATSNAELLGHVQLRDLHPPGPVLTGARVEPWLEAWQGTRS